MGWKESKNYSCGKMNYLKYQIKTNEKSRDEVVRESYKLYKEVQKLKKEKEKISKEKEKLERELKKYKNANTPSSANNHLQTNTQKTKEDDKRPNKVGRKKGKKSNHKGKTRIPDVPTDFVDVITDINPLTGNKNIEPTGYVEERTITDFKIIKTVTQYNVHEYRDLDTKEIFMATHENLPEKGIFGKNVLAFTGHLRYYCRVPFYRIANTFTTVFNTPMTAPTALEICNRVGNKLSPHYEKLKVAIQNERVVNADETGAKRNGMPGWLWGFFSLSIALFIFNGKRGGEIVQDTLGKQFKGLLGCDGWSTYAVFSKNFGVLLQRCWAHALREVKHECFSGKLRQNAQLKGAYDSLCDIFTKVKESRKLENEPIRKKKYEELTLELNQWIQMYSSYKKLKKVVNKIKNGKEFWFTCVLYPEIEPTNNRAERGLRSWVVMRKIIGCLRSEQGEKTTQIMLSLFQTWDLQGLNHYNQLRSLL